MVHKPGGKGTTVFICHLIFKREAVEMCAYAMRARQAFLALQSMTVNSKFTLKCHNTRKTWPTNDMLSCSEFLDTKKGNESVDDLARAGAVYLIKIHCFKPENTRNLF